MNTSRRTWIRLATAALVGSWAGGATGQVEAGDGPNSSLFSGRLEGLRIARRQAEPLAQPGPLAPPTQSAQPNTPAPGSFATAPQPTTSWYESPLPPPGRRDFQGQLDQVLAAHLSDATADSFAGPMLDMFMLHRH